MFSSFLDNRILCRNFEIDVPLRFNEKKISLAAPQNKLWTNKKFTSDKIKDNQATNNKHNYYYLHSLGKTNSLWVRRSLTLWWTRWMSTLNCRPFEVIVLSFKKLFPPCQITFYGTIIRKKYPGYFSLVYFFTFSYFQEIYPRIHQGNIYPWVGERSKSTGVG